jgi:hypothetical protein
MGSGEGLEALNELFQADAVAIVGEKGKHRKDRIHNWWGTTETEIRFGWRRIQADRPRVRRKSGGR